MPNDATKEKWLLNKHNSVPIYLVILRNKLWAVKYLSRNIISVIAVKSQTKYKEL